MIDYLCDLHKMEPVDINAAAVRMLTKLLNHASLNLVSTLSGVTRATLYRWMNEAIDLNDMNHHTAAWFILVVETDPRFEMILQRQSSRPHLTHRILEEE